MTIHWKREDPKIGIVTTLIVHNVKQPIVHYQKTSFHGKAIHN